MAANATTGVAQHKRILSCLALVMFACSKPVSKTQTVDDACTGISLSIVSSEFEDYDYTIEPGKPQIRRVCRVEYLVANDTPSPYAFVWTDPYNLALDSQVPKMTQSLRHYGRHLYSLPELHSKMLDAGSEFKFISRYIGEATAIQTEFAFICKPSAEIIDLLNRHQDTTAYGPVFDQLESSTDVMRVLIEACSGTNELKIIPVHTSTDPELPKLD